MGYYLRIAGNDALVQELHNALIEEGAEPISSEVFPRELLYQGVPIWFLQAERAVRDGKLAVTRLSWMSSPEAVAELTRGLLGICQRLGLDIYADGLEKALRPEDLGDVLAEFSSGAEWALKIFPPVSAPARHRSA